MKLVLKRVSLLLVATLTLASFTGCGKTAKTENPTKGTEVGEVAVEDSNFNATGMPIVNEPVELTVMTMRWGDMGDSFAQNQWLIDLEKNSNVKINWTVASSNDWAEQKSILLAGGNLPDIFLGSGTINDGDILKNLEFFTPLDSLIENNMPNYKHAMEVYPAFGTISTFPDGNIYSLAKNLPARPMTRNQPIINKTWLDNLGLEIPDTYEDLAKVLKAFKEQDANGNGDPNDEIPFSSNGDIHVDLLNPFGITDINETSMSILDGEAFFFPTSERYKEAIGWVKNLYADGIIDPEIFTQDDSMLTGKYVDESAPLIGLTFQWTPDSVMGKWSDQYVAIPPLAGPDGQRYAGGDKDGVFSIMRNEAVITTSCKNPEVAARWLDEFYTNEASIQNFWGAIGTVINKNDDETYSLNTPPEGTSADAWYWDQSFRDFGPKFVDPDFTEKIILNKDSGDGFKLEISKLSNQYVTEPFPSLIYTEEETEELAIIGTDVAGYVLHMRAKWIMDGGIEEEWGEYVEQLNAMGLERLIEIRMDAYNRSK